MKRSQINALIERSVKFVREQGFLLPPFAYWTAEDWKTKGPEYDEIRDNLLGWDVTDFASGSFETRGLVAFTLRNGSQKDPKRYPKPYAEKILIIDEGQILPCHFHWIKMEDIINRGGGDFMLRIHSADEKEALSDNPVTVHIDGRKQTVEAGAVLRIRPGESITLMQRQYHSFWAEGGRVLLGEVSMTNDDNTDNRFYEPLPRFTQIEEDEPPRYLLCNEYRKA